ncbi:putative para-aminobenzoate synthase component I [Gordonia araii NBRC 100433]|uniref:Putative para-aminobenzoate synthase component I n=1 Tax=Gordonia araii NBRC 100433 TaxID=1073574 RepID=G7H628_9ACTN|nr:aminodeoxychorismate synthase component I [Gordonia araii]NNG98734.1 aminodeoxychorismate synthase component I [Gordonia araii NBRC 100433]GAB11267.1 putative para-aminobenzoate synthase component I [Gordonia araii NBRC 100433]
MSPSALDVLRSLHHGARRAGLPPPAALIGSWLDADAVIAPSLELVAGLAPPDDPDRFWLGHLGFPVGVDDSPFPAVAGGLTDAVLLLRDGRWSYVSVTGAARPDWVAEALQTAAAPGPVVARWHPPTRERHDAHRAAVASALEAIAAGEIYQVCICTRLDGRLDGAPLDFFGMVAAATAPVKSAFLQGDWGTLASFSPESFLRRRGSAVTSSPIKGTIPADADPRDLAMSVKDVAENVMIVDLVRNDLGRVARIGTVTVPELLTVVGAPGVWHLVSTVRAELDDEVGNDALLDATFPPASVTGTPKIRAAELIGQWETLPRGVYCGAIGLAGPDHALDLSVAIRTVEIDPDGAMRLGVGGGITVDSDPSREWQECLDKAAAIVR